MVRWVHYISVLSFVTGATEAVPLPFTESGAFSVGRFRFVGWLARLVVLWELADPHARDIRIRENRTQGGHTKHLK
jgi:hypothetical protein